MGTDCLASSMIAGKPSAASAWLAASTRSSRNRADVMRLRAIQALLALYGYRLELTGVYDKSTETVVAAFQRHFRPERIDGLADASTLATLKALLEGATG